MPKPSTAQAANSITAPFRSGQHDEAGGQNDVRQHQHPASAVTVDDAADRRTGEGGDEQSRRERTEYS